MEGSKLRAAAEVVGVLGVGGSVSIPVPYLDRRAAPSR